MATAERFSGFPEGTLTFLTALRTNNNKEWFEAHRSDYDRYYVEPAKAFVQAVGTKLKTAAPAIVADPRVNGSIFRINRDMRFSKDKRPYKDHLDFSFWEGGKNASPSALFFRISPDGTSIGAGNHSCPQLLRPLRQAIADPVSGKRLAAVAKKLRTAGCTIEGAHYKRFPRNFSNDGPASEFLLHNSLYVVMEKEPEVACSKEIVNVCVKQWKAMMPLHRWLVDNIR